jgi:hypothetical protein
MVAGGNAWLGRAWIERVRITVAPVAHELGNAATVRATRWFDPDDDPGPCCFCSATSSFVCVELQLVSGEPPLGGRT